MKKYKTIASLIIGVDLLIKLLLRTAFQSWIGTNNRLMYGLYFRPLFNTYRSGINALLGIESTALSRGILDVISFIVIFVVVLYIGFKVPCGKLKKRNMLYSYLFFGAVMERLLRVFFSTYTLDYIGIMNITFDLADFCIFFSATGLAINLIHLDLLQRKERGKRTYKQKFQDEIEDHKQFLEYLKLHFTKTI
ncbi:MAG: hypothetical protein E7256_18175 [Lachnospiraceae bacterium]|nr:hypothetical protein [Lachnospiraceae bacterium]